MSDEVRKNDDVINAETIGRQVMGRRSIFIMILVLILAGFTFQENMLHFPHFQDAEGTNMANAWALLEIGELTPYTYAYEEAPVSNFIFAGWVAATDGFNTFFEFPINSGRVLMFILHLMTVALVYMTTRKLSGSDTAAIIAAAIFSLSPLALSIQRRVITDNLMIVFLLGSFFLTVGKDRSLYHHMLSALLFGLAVLIKSGAIIFLPAMIFTLRQTVSPFNRRFAINIWLTFSMILISTYPLYAHMREELFPQGWLLGGDFPHVSLIERILDSGPNDSFIANLGQGIGLSLSEWTDLANFTADPVLIYGGALSLIFLLILARDNRQLRPLTAFAMTYVFGMTISGRVVPTDVLPLLPFLSISMGLLIAILVELVSSMGGKSLMRPVFGLVALVVLLYPFWWFYGNRIQIYTLDQVSGQLDAVAWLDENAATNSTIITDNYAFVALRQNMPNVHHYWKVDTDPDVKFTLLDDNFCNIDYVLTTPQVYDDMRIFGLDLVRRAIENSEPILEFENNGWPVEIRQVSKLNCDTIDLDFGTRGADSDSTSADTVEEPDSATDDEPSSTDESPPPSNT